mgnify:CR=1 FL=1
MNEPVRPTERWQNGVTAEPARPTEAKTTKVFEFGYFFQIEANTLEEAFKEGADFLSSKSWNDVTAAPYTYLEYYPDEEDEL